LRLTVLGGLAEFERELIKARTGEGRRRAKAIERRERGESLTDIGRSYNVSAATISRLTA
jgi:hypothetical protein